MPKLSVVVPVYNMEKYLRKCLDSIIDETIDDYEIIIVNDGSTDSSPAICQEYAEHYPKLINYISTPNGGLGAARNVGTENAKGEFIFYIDSDDYLAPNALREVMDSLQDDVDICVFDFLNITEDGRVLSLTKGSERTGDFSLSDYPEFLFCPPNAWNKIWKRNIFTDNGIVFPGRVWFEDIYITPKLYTKARKIKYVDKAWYMYLQRDGSITKNKNPQRCLEIIDAVDSVLKYYRSVDLFEQYYPQLCYMALYHQVITSTTRVSLIDRNSPIQRQLFEDFLEKFPDYKSVSYVQSMPGKLKLLLFYIEHRMYTAFNFTMRLNNRIKRK